MNDTNLDVIIVGAGPTGLLLAIELGLAGASVVALERRTTIDTTIKAGGIGALAAEALARRGLAPALDAAETVSVETMQRMFRQAATRLPPLKKIGGHFAGLFLIDPARQDQPGRRFRLVPQAALEQTLETRAAAAGIDILRCCNVKTFTQDTRGVCVEIEGPEGTATLRARYLVGCDGGRSMVRKHAGFDFPGTAPTLTGHQAIVELDRPERLLPMGWRRTTTGMLAYGPVPGRIFLAEFDGPPADREAPVTREDLEARLRHVSGADVRILSVKSATRFTDHARQADTYRRGRVLLAGDAAHVHSPFGGQGLNLGLVDAVNLGWKLAAVARGALPESLLDSYTTERHPVAARVLDNTRAQVALMRPDPQTTALRDIVADVMALDAGNRFFGDMMSGLRTRYDLGDRNPLVGTLAGDRAVTTAYGEPTLFEAMQDARPIVVDASGGDVARAASDWADRVNCLRAAHGPSMLLRPDACIAWANDGPGTQGLREALLRWVGAPGLQRAARRPLQPLSSSSTGV